MVTSMTAAIFMSLLLTFFGASARPATALEIPSGITVGAAIDQIKGALDDAIRQACAEADFAVAKAALEAKTVIGAWEQSNGDILEELFSGIGHQRRKTLDGALEVLDEADDDAQGLAEQAEDITASVAQMTANLPLGDAAYITAVSPRVILPTAGDVVLRVTGVNLDRGEISIRLPDGSEAAKNLISATLAEFMIPKQHLQFGNKGISLVRLKTSWTKPLWWFFGRQPMTGSLDLALLPATLGVASIKEGLVPETRREIVRYRVHVGEYRGKDRTIKEVAKPLSGYKWLATKQAEFAVQQGHGEAASCHPTPVWSESTEDGIVVSARVNRRRTLGTPDGDGYVNCDLSGPVYRDVQVEAPLAASPPITLTWTADASFSVPANIKSATLLVETFDGRSYQLTTSGSAGPFVSVVYDREAGKIFLRPRIPSGL